MHIQVRFFSVFCIFGSDNRFHTSGTIKTLYGVWTSTQIFIFSYLTSRYEKDFLFVPGYEKAPFRTAVRNRLQKLRLQSFIYTHTLYATPHAGHNIKRYMKRNATGLGGMRTARSCHLTRLGSRGSTDFWRRGAIL